MPEYCVSKQVMFLPELLIKCSTNLDTCYPIQSIQYALMTVFTPCQKINLLFKYC